MKKKYFIPTVRPELAYFNKNKGYDKTKSINVYKLVVKKVKYYL